MCKGNMTTHCINFARFLIRFKLILILIACAGDSTNGRGDTHSSTDTSTSTQTDTSDNTDTDSDDDGTEACRKEFENQMVDILQTLETDTEFTLYLETEDQNRFTFSRGRSTLFTSYTSASTSKWVSAVIILRLVDQGVLTLEDRPQDHIPNWEIPDIDPLFDLTLSHLLSLTSGLTVDDPCVNLAESDFERCVRQIAAINSGGEKFPGAEFDYGHAHLQVAGLMAVKAAGVDSWQDLFEAFRSDTGLFPNSSFDVPSLDNPRLAAGMHWQARDYVDFIRAFQFGDLLTDASKSLMMTDQITTAVMADSPIVTSLNQEWHYGFGIWLECPQVVFNCHNIFTDSSPGIYGAYPFSNLRDRFFGLVARRGAAYTIAEGKAVYDAVAPIAERWAQIPDSCR